jgi:ActD protein
MELHRSHIYGVLGEFTTPHDLMRAAEKAREAGYRRMDAYTPFPIEGLSEALGLKRSLVPTVTLIGGLLGGLTGFGFQYWASVISYPENIGGRSLNSWPAFIPVTFEMTVLGASLFAVFGMLAMNRLPQPHHPLFNVHRFQKHASTDRFYLCLQANDKKFNLEEAARFLQDVSAQHVSEVRDD